MNDKLKELNTLRKQLVDKETEIANFELDEDSYKNRYDEMLDECYDEFMNLYSPSYTLKCVDEIAYNCGLSDYVDGLGKEEDEDYIALIEEKEDLELLIEDLENELEEE